MNKRARQAQIDNKTRQIVHDRDEEMNYPYKCLFCRMGYKLEGATPYNTSSFEIMHIVPRSQGGLGRDAKNLVTGCMYHHRMLDESENRKDMMEIINEYMSDIYMDWDTEKLVYDKWGSLKVS